MVISQTDMTGTFPMISRSLGLWSLGLFGLVGKQFSDKTRAVLAYNLIDGEFNSIWALVYHLIRSRQNIRWNRQTDLLGSFVNVLFLASAMSASILRTRGERGVEWES
jgi:hypothetical protein